MFATRRLTAYVLAAALALFAFGCGGGQPAADSDPAGQTPAAETPQAAEPETKKEPTVIAFWHAMNPESGHGQTLIELVDRFNRSQSDYRVDHLYQGGYGDLNTKLLAAVADRKPPAMAQLVDDVMARLWHAQQLAALDPFITDPQTGLSQSELADFPPFFLDATRIGGKQVAMPFSKSTQVLIYDKALVPTPPTTWEEFRSVARQVTRDDNGDGTPELYGTVFKPDIDYMDLFMGGAGARWVSADGQSAVFDSPEAVQALEFIIAMFKEQTALQQPANTYASDIFNQGRVAMVATTSASLPYIHQGSDGVRDWAVAPLFSGPRGNKTPFFGNNLGIFSLASPEQQRGAWAFIKFLTSPETTAYWATRTGYVPVRFSALEHPTWVEFKAKNPNDAVPAEQLNRGTFQPIHPDWYGARTTISTAIEAAVLGQMSAQEALSGAAKEVSMQLQGG